jgi:hypothetical protein
MTDSTQVSEAEIANCCNRSTEDRLGKSGLCGLNARQISGWCCGQERDCRIGYSFAVAVFGLNSGEAFTGEVGPLIEAPTLIGSVNLAFWLRSRVYAALISTVKSAARLENRPRLFLS